MKKRLAAFAALVFLLVVLIVVLRKPVQIPPSAWLVLPDGSSNRIVAVTYGTNHLIGPAFGRMMAHLPEVVQDELPVLIHRTDMVRPALVVWIEHRPIPSTPPSASWDEAYQRLSDGDGFISGPRNSPAGSFGTLDIGPAVFEAFPRRDPKLTVNFFYRLPSGQVTNCGSLQFPNPLQRAYPEWQPEPLPAKRVTSDFEVTLLGVQARKDDTWVDLRMPTPAGGVTWQIVGVECSDATGNSVHDYPMNFSFRGDGRGNDIGFSLQSGLWPSEKAWKLKLELARTSGFAPDTLLTFEHVPLGPAGGSSVVGWTTNFAGVILTLDRITRGTPSNLKLTNSRLPAGTRLDLLSIAYDQGTTNRCESFSFSDTERDYALSQIPPDAKTADFTFAIHQSRFVEFTVHPEPPTTAAHSKTEVQPQMDADGHK